MTGIRRLRDAPDRDAALDQYRRRADVYDVELAVFEPLRRKAVALLGLQPGATVIDAGCGTGLSFGLLHAAIGRKGRIVGIEQSPEMCAKARARVAAEHWSNVGLVEQPVELARLEGRPADAALFHFTHDVLRRPEAIANVLGHLRPGARVVAVGLKWASPLMWPVNLFVLSAALRSVTSLEGLAAPWSHLHAQLGAIEVEPALFGAAYIACGTTPP
ncbi:MAG: methyltransferase domain-containing protein [Proteobacteria bacterium]|nr:methyltransferase domain-containing protein [Pseudomonadota bacterium]